MNGRTLMSPRAALSSIAQTFIKDSVCQILVREDHAFVPDGFLKLGDLEIFPATHDNIESVTRATKFGEFEWRTPSLIAAMASLKELLSASGLSGDAKLKADDKIRRVCDSLGGVSSRLGLRNPILDPLALEAMPFRRPTTVISDTSAVLQGGLTFVAQNLHPAARIKVPAVVQMEIVNFADRFLSNWRATKVKPIDLLMDHIGSQAGQRVLLQLELNSEVELERTFLLGDPLRGAFQRDEDKELRELNLNASIRAYADRLILEAARQHQSQASFGHHVMLMTSDQGLARMAMAEGLSPLYFKAAKADALFGRRLSGINLDPFSGALRTRSIPEVLWELATIFGWARLVTRDGQHGINVQAIGTDLSWAPYHSRDDLLWVTPHLDPGNALLDQGTPVADAPASAEQAQDTGPLAPKDGEERLPEGRSSFASYKISVDRLFSLIDALDSQQTLPVQSVLDILQVKTLSALREYKGFLESGDAVRIEGDVWHSTDRLRLLSVALRNKDTSEFRATMSIFPSFAFMVQTLSDSQAKEPLPEKLFGRATATLLTFAELSELGASVLGRGFYRTIDEISDAEFVQYALNSYQVVKNDEGWAETGAWLEDMVVRHGVHPAVTRIRLQGASEAGLLKRVVEGSTTDTKNDRHIVRSIEVQDGSPIVQINHLYRGDFLMPGKGSSSIRLEEVQP